MSMGDNDGQMIFGDLGALKLPDICITGEEKPRKNLAQETCPDRGSNPRPLHDRLTCYHLLHSGGWETSSHGDIPLLECCFSPNNASKIARCGLVCCPDEGTMRHFSSSLISFIGHVHGGSSNIFVINLFDSLTFRHPINVDNLPLDIEKTIIALNFSLLMCFLLPMGLGSSNAWIVA